LQWKHDETFIPAGARIGDTVDDTPTAAAATGATGKGK
jgi:hypothetical protein